MRPFRNPSAILLACAVVVGACSPAATPPSPPPWSVRDGFIRDVDGRAVILRGANVAGAAKEPPYFGFQQAADFQRMRTEWGFNAVRFIMQWTALEPEQGRYDADYLAGVRLRLDWAHAAGLLVVLDMHQDVYGPGFTGGNGAPRWTCDAANYADFVPTEPWFLNYATPQVVACFDHFWTDLPTQQAYADAWREVARALGDHPAVIGFDVMNEPYLGSFSIDEFEPGALQPMYELVVPAVRSAAPSWLAFLEPSSMRNLGRATQLRPFPFEGVVYSPHSYDNAAESGQAFDPARRDAILRNTDALAAEARSLNAALWVGEYGGVASHPGITEYMRAELDAADRNLAGAMYWAYDRSDGYAILAPDGSEKTALLDEIVRPYPERVAGTPLQWSFDDVTATFTLRFRAEGDGPTVLSVPLRRYPGGPRASCSGCTATVDGASVVVTAASGEATVTVTGP